MPDDLVALRDAAVQCFGWPCATAPVTLGRVNPLTDPQTSATLAASQPQEGRESIPWTAPAVVARIKKNKKIFFFSKTPLSLSLSGFLRKPLSLCPSVCLSVSLSLWQTSIHLYIIKSLTDSNDCRRINQLRLHNVSQCQCQCQPV